MAIVHIKKEAKPRQSNKKTQAKQQNKTTKTWFNEGITKCCLCLEEGVTNFEERVRERVIFIAFNWGGKR